MFKFNKKTPTKVPVEEYLSQNLNLKWKFKIKTVCSEQLFSMKSFSEWFYITFVNSARFYEAEGKYYIRCHVKQ